MKSLSQVIKEIDFYGKPYMFEENESQKFHTKFGNILTFLVIVTCIVIGFLFGKEIYERKSPVVIISEETTPVSRFNLSEYPILFSFFDKDGFTIKDPLSVFTVDSLTLEFDSSLKSNFQNHVGLHKCDANKFGETFREVVSNQLTYGSSASQQPVDFYCLHHQGLFLQNDYLSPNSTALKVRFAKCNPNQRICPPNYDDLAKNFFIAVMTFDSYIDSKDYSNPIRYYLKTIGKEVNDMFSKTNYISIEKSNLINNKGWLLENIEEKVFFSQRQAKEDVNLIIDNYLYQIILDSPNRRQVITRSYLRIQDLFAKIGGILNFLLISTSLLTKNYVDYNYYSYFAGVFNVKNKFSNSFIVNNIDDVDLKNKPIKENKKIYDSSVNMFKFSDNKLLKHTDLLKLNSPAVIDSKKDKCISSPPNKNTEVDVRAVSKFKNAKNNSQVGIINDEVNISYLKNDVKEDKECKMSNYNFSEFKPLNYFSYIWKEKIMCQKTNTKDYFNGVKELLSFNNILRTNVINVG